jgi:hypothetical protein
MATLSVPQSKLRKLLKALKTERMNMLGGYHPASQRVTEQATALLHERREHLEQELARKV